jgi:hypothetical protein
MQFRTDPLFDPFVAWTHAEWILEHAGPDAIGRPQVELWYEALRSRDIVRQKDSLRNSAEMSVEESTARSLIEDRLKKTDGGEPSQMPGISQPAEAGRHGLPFYLEPAEMPRFSASFAGRSE